MKDENKDRLETFVKTNRQNFDQEVPGDHVWVDIDQRISRTLKPWYQQEVWLWRAASVVLLMVSLFLYQNNKTPAKHYIANNNNHEFDQVEGYYASMISEKRSQIDLFQEGKIEADDAYVVDLQRLDAMYEVLKEELVRNPSKEMKDALTLNLLIRIDLLNNQLQTIEELDREEEEPVGKSV
jgi:hypothetical protein